MLCPEPCVDCSCAARHHPISYCLVMEHPQQDKDSSISIQNTPRRPLYPAASDKGENAKFDVSYLESEASSELQPKPTLLQVPFAQLFSLPTCWVQMQTNPFHQ